MKKQLLFILTMILAYHVNAQVCTPGAVTDPRSGYILPDSATGFNHACAGHYYEQIIYIKAPADTSFEYNGNPINATVDSFVVNANITNLPAYLTVESNPALRPAAPGNPKTDFPRLVIPGGSLACVRISGTVPAGTAAGSADLIVGVRAYLNALGGLIRLDTPANVDYYKFIIDEPGTGACLTASVKNTEKLTVFGVQAIPNPATDNVTIQLEATAAQKAEIAVYSLLGSKVASKNVTIQAGTNKIPVSVGNLSSGVYMYRVHTDKGSVSDRLIITK